jgi:hypothetical protein
MAALKADEQGNIQFPPEHAVTMDLSERNAQMRDEDGFVYDVGYFQLERNMIQSIDTFELEIFTNDSRQERSGTCGRDS